MNSVAEDKERRRGKAKQETSRLGLKEKIDKSRTDASRGVRMQADTSCRCSPVVCDELKKIDQLQLRKFSDTGRNTVFSLRRGEKFGSGDMT